MIIGLDGSRAFLKYRTGIEEYSYQVIKHLRNTLPSNAQVRVYVRKKISWQKGRLVFIYPPIDFSFPENWTLVGLWAPRFWTQARLSLEMLLHPVDALFIPAHTVPVIHPENTAVTIHGLEYEVSPKSYSLWERFYMRSSIRYSVSAAKKIIAVSQNTKKDLERLYHIPAQKIQVVHEGFAFRPAEKRPKKDTILFIGRLEERKNVARIIEAFEMLKEKHRLPHQLVLVGKPGYGYEKIETKVRNSEWRDDIQELGYITQEEKEKLLQEAGAFIFPSLYEGFGLPILEAQAAGTPVITSNTSSLPEVAGEGALYVDPENVEDIVRSLTLSLKEAKRVELVGKGFKNLERFSWEKCAMEIVEILREK